MFQKLRSRERGLMAVGADERVEDRKDDQIYSDVVHDRPKGVQHRISSDWDGDRKIQKNPDLPGWAASFDDMNIRTK
jgi:hypothetical protein